MAVTQYIGARYVPIFADPLEWTNTKQYEPLTIVEHQGNSFTSKQFVPVGVDIDDTDYWVETGNYNAQVESYREEVLTFNDRVTSNTNNIDSIIEKLPSADFSSTNTVKKYIDDNVIPLQKLTHRTMVCIGDSYGRGTYRKPDNSGFGDAPTGWLRWMEAHAALLGCTVYTNLNTIIPGASGFASTAKFIDTMNQMVSSNVVPDTNAVTDLVVIGGTNDVGQSFNTLVTAIDAFCIRAKELFPNATIRIGYISVYMDRGIASCYSRGAARNGVEFMYTLFNLLFQPEYISPDGTHPTEAAYNSIIDFMVQAVMTGKTAYYFEHPWNIGTSPSYTIRNLQILDVVTERSHTLVIRPSTPGVGDHPSISPTNWQDNPGPELEIPVDNIPKLGNTYSRALCQMYRRAWLRIQPVGSTNAVSEWFTAVIGYAYVNAATPNILRIKMFGFPPNDDDSNRAYIFGYTNTVVQNEV